MVKNGNFVLIPSIAGRISIIRVMKRICHSSFYKFLIAGLLLLPALTHAQSIDSTLTFLINEGDADGLLEYFDESVDLGLPDADQDYGRKQAFMVMKDFFKNYPPEKFTLKESGFTSENNMFLIGDYITGEDAYQLLVLLRRSGERLLIHKMKFESKSLPEK
jgi:hypothetical protein